MYPLPFVFVVGSSRSGTTLLRAMLSAHPELAIPGESHFIPALAARHGDASTFSVEGFLRDLSTHDRFRRWDLSLDLVRRELVAEATRDLSSALRALYRTYARQMGKTRYGDKTPEYVGKIPLLVELFPESRFIHIIRDGRDVALSMIDRGWTGKSVPEAALSWKNRVLAGRRDGHPLGEARYKEVFYEKLVAQPEEVLRDLGSFIDLPFDHRMLEYQSTFSEVVKSFKYPQRHQSLKLEPTAGLRDWRRDLSRGDVSLFEAVAGDLLADLGYERAHEKIPPLSRWRAFGMALPDRVRGALRYSRRRGR